VLRECGLLVAATVLSASSALGQHAFTYRPGIDILHYDLALDLPETGKSIAGRATLTVARRAAVDTLLLDLVGLRVDSTLVAGRAAPFVRDSLTVRIALPRYTGPDTLRVSVGYHGEPSDGLIIRTDSMGRWTAFGDNWPTRARHWIPSVDDPSDKALVTWAVTAPAGRRVVANGELVEETPLPIARGSDSQPRALTRWRTLRPIPVYLMVIAAAPLAYYDLGPSACGRSEIGGCVRQSLYAAPEARDYLPGPFAKADEIVTFFSTLIAPFPYEKLAHLQSSTRFGGMENASAIFYSDRLFRERTLRPGLIAHETAHQWFGNSVTEHRWADLWLSEGFASYLEQLWVQRFEGDSAFRAGMARIRQEIIQSPEVASRPVVDSAERDYLKLLNENSYQKGAWTLHMLRTQLGDSTFFRGVRAYYAAHRHSTAKTDDLRRAMEKASGQSLAWFFRQWLERPGFPEVRTSWEYDRTAKRVRLVVRQSERFGLYRFPLTVEVRTAQGVRRLSVDVPAKMVTTLTLPMAMAHRPASVDVDPGIALLATFSK